MSARMDTSPATMPTVADYSKRWLDGLDLEAASVAGYRRIFALHGNPATRALRLDKVLPTRLVTSRTAGSGPESLSMPTIIGRILARVTLRL